MQSADIPERPSESFVEEQKDLLLLIGVYYMSIAIGLEAVLAPLTADTRFLVSAKESLRRWLLKRIHKD